MERLGDIVDDFQFLAAQVGPSAFAPAPDTSQTTWQALVTLKMAGLACQAARLDLRQTESGELCWIQAHVAGHIYLFPEQSELK